ncbi:MAG: hypothetical protein U0797_12780 [Gemmataceae bacterium]
MAGFPPSIRSCVRIRLVCGQAVRDLPNASTLRRFLALQEQEAFAAAWSAARLALVWGVCRHVLPGGTTPRRLPGRLPRAGRRAASIRKSESVSGLAVRRGLPSFPEGQADGDPPPAARRAAVGRRPRRRTTAWRG